MIKAIFFDLDGTLLPLNEELFTKYYFELLFSKVSHLGYDKKKLIDSIWGGTKKMYQNDGSISNEEAFWNYFQSIYGDSRLKDKDVFDDFYINEFKKTKEICGNNPYALDIINYCKKNFEYVVLSTNPIFPMNAINTRLEFIGLDTNKFTYVTSYENSRFTKPNPKYFVDILNKFNLNPDEVILFGNNAYEDYYAAKLAGIKCYLVGDYVIENDKVEYNMPYIPLKDIVSVIESEVLGIK